MCTGTPNNSYAEAAMYANNQYMNNPMAYAMIMGMMRWIFGNDWQQRMPYDADIQCRFNQLNTLISDNHNTEIINDAVKGNSARLSELASIFNVDIRTIQSGLCNINASLQHIDGEVKYTGERVINSNILGLKDLQASFKDCCCQQKELTQRMGYENMLGQKDLLASLQQGHNMLGYQMQQGFDRTNTGLERGFSNIGFITEQQTCRIEKAISESSQRQIDAMNAHWNQDLRDKLAQMSQDAQTAQIVNQLRNNGCGCN